MGQAISSSSSSSCSSSSFPNQPTNDLTLLLPEECLATIFTKLNCRERNGCSLVCKRWKSVDSKNRQRLALYAKSDLSGFLTHLLLRFENVSVLSLKCSRKVLSIDDKALCRIAMSLKFLKKLKLKGCVEITDDGLDSFSVICKKGALKKFSCASCSFGAKGLNAVIENCEQLQDLTLKRLRKLDGQNIPLGSQICGGNKLQRLCLKDLHNAQLFAPLLRASVDLKTLILCRSQGSWDHVLEGQDLKELMEIQVENVQLGDTGLLALSRCINLEILYLSRATDCTDLGFSAVANGCRKLRKIHVDGCKFNRIGDDGLLSVASRCSQLQEIVLMGIPVTVVTLNALANNCAFLERMALCNTDSIGDPELGFVAAKFSALKKLCIKNCPVSDSGIEAIGAGCPNLVKLKVKRCKDVTEVSVVWLRLQRRSLVVSVDVGSLVGADEEETARVAGEGEEAAGAGGRHRRTISNSTHLVCGRRGTSIFSSKLGNAASNLLRRPSMPRER